MRYPMQALLWEQWRRTWKVIPFAIAMLMIILWLLPQYLLDQNLQQWSLEAGTIMCVLLCGLFWIALQGEGGARAAAIADRHFVLPVASLLLAVIYVLPFLLALAATLAAGLAIVPFSVEASVGSAAQTNAISVNIHLMVCLVLAYSLTVGLRVNSLLRILLVVLVLIILVLLGNALSSFLSARIISIFALGISIPAAAFIISRDRHQREPRLDLVLLRPVAALADRCENLARPVPVDPGAASLWRELRGGKSLILPAAIAVVGVVIFLGFFVMGLVGGKVLTNLQTTPDAHNLWGICLCLSGFALFIYVVARIAPRLAGGTNLFAPWSAESSFWRRQPLPSRALATVKLKALMLQCLCWGVCLCAMVAFFLVFEEIFHWNLSKVLNDAVEFQQKVGTLGAIRSALRPVALTGLILWSLSGLVSAIALTGRKWVYSVGFTSITIAAVLVMRLFTIPISWKYYETVQPLKTLAAILIIAFAIVPLIWTAIKGYAARGTLAILVICCVAAELIVASVNVDEPPTSHLLHLSLYAIPFAPLGLLPIALRWGRKL